MPRPFHTLLELLQNSVEDFPEREVFGTKNGDGSWTWIHVREFEAVVAQARAGLAALGVQKGDRVGIVSDNRVEWAVCAFACYMLGACYVPMYEAQESKDWKFILADCGAKVVVAATKPIYETLQSFRPELPALTRVVCLALPREDEDSYAHLLEVGKSAPVPAPSIAPQDLAAFI